jgi:pilus assembly protein CpaF
MLRDTLKPIAWLVDDPQVQEIMINRQNDVWVERDGRMCRESVELSEPQIRTAIQVLGSISNKDVSAAGRDAILDGRLETMRVAAAIPPVSIHGASMCLRKHTRREMTLKDFAVQGAFRVEEDRRKLFDEQARPDSACVKRGDAALEAFLRWAVMSRKNIIIAGSTTTGKTTFLNALLAEIPECERVISIEDTPELNVRTANFVSFESNEQINVSTRDLVRLALRYRPDRIVLGEVRGGEAFDLLQALATGHDGGVGTLHANDARSALSRLEQLVLQSGVDWPLEAIRPQIAAAFDLIVQLARPGGTRCVAEVVEITGYRDNRYQVAEVFKRSAA